MSMPEAPIATIIIHSALKSAPNLALNDFLPGSFEVLTSLLVLGLDVILRRLSVSTRREWQEISIGQSMPCE